MLRYLTAGESHGRALVAILEGMPAGVPVGLEEFDALMARRQIGYGRGPRAKIEADQVEVLSGIWRGLTIGSPIALIIRNADHCFDPSKPPNVAQDPRSSFLEGLPAGHVETLVGAASRREVPDHPVLKNAPLTPITVPIPGHADLAGALKYGFDDFRPVRERASARETAIRTAISVPARQLLEELGVKSVGFVAELGGQAAGVPDAATVMQLREAILQNECWFLTPDEKVVEPWKRLVDEARDASDSLGGIAEIRLDGLPAGLGSHVDAARRLDARLAASLMGIPGVRVVEVGQGVRQCRSRGKQAHDPISFAADDGWTRSSNLAGGLEGGMTNGEQLVIRCFMKPPPGPCRIGSADLHTGHPAQPERYRSDTAAPDTLAVVAESLVAIELASAILEKFGGDSLDDIRSTLANYRRRTIELPSSR